MATQKQVEDAVRNALDKFSTETNGGKTLKTSATLTGTVTLAEVEIKNDSGNEIPANISKIGGSALSIGQQLSAASIPVVLPAAQITTLTPPAAITGFSTETTLNKIPGLSIPIHDYIENTYTGDNLTTVIYKLGGSGGSIVATLTLTYSGSNILTVTKT